MKKVTIGLIQTSVTEDPNRNLKEAIEKAMGAISRGAQIICLSELFRTVYFPQTEHAEASCFAETIPGESTDAFSALAKKHGVVIIVPLFEKAAKDHYYNSVAVINADGKLMPAYRKMHIPHDPLFYEKNYFRDGDRDFLVYDTRYAKIAVLICYDQWFPEAARIVALKGADIIFYPTAIGWMAGEGMPPEGDWHDAWETVQRGHAIANGVHVAAVNRVGQEGELLFWGSSFVCDSFGQVLKRASHKDEEVLVVEIDLDKNREIQEGWGFFRNRRPETYGVLIEPLAEPMRPSQGYAATTLSPLAGRICPKDTPLKLGYHMPAEWEKHDAIWLSWPYDLNSFPQINQVEKTYVSIIKAIHESETVNLLVTDETMMLRAVALLKNAGLKLGRLRLHQIEYADVWFRDYGPTYVVNSASKKLAMVNWIFNAWGKKYTELMRDARIPCQINEDLKLECFQPGIVMEGGSIDVNGQGCILTTEQCLLNRNRNPQLRRVEIECYLQEYLGAGKVIWLKEGIAGDDTDGHVDDIARFVAPNRVLCAYEENEKDENYPALKENYEILCSSTDQDGRPLKVTKLPMPGLVGEEERLPASYANFYIGNATVLVPIFGYKNDQIALKIIQEAFPQRKVVGINCRELVYGLGTIHCISSQQPSILP
jgi:agmatine deiminase